MELSLPRAIRVGGIVPRTATGTAELWEKRPDRDESCHRSRSGPGPPPSDLASAGTGRDDGRHRGEVPQGVDSDRFRERGGQIECLMINRNADVDHGRSRGVID